MSFCTLTLRIFVFAPCSTPSQTSLNRILRFSDHCPYHLSQLSFSYPSLQLMDPFPPWSISTIPRITMLLVPDSLMVSMCDCKVEGHWFKPCLNWRPLFKESGVLYHLDNDLMLYQLGSAHEVLMNTHIIIVMTHKCNIDK